MANERPMPRGWEKSRSGEYIAHRQLDDYLYAKIKYDPQKDHYVLVSMQCDGPKQINVLGYHSDLDSAFRAGDRL